MSIPKNLHFCWFGSNDISAINEQCVESWKRFLPDWKFYFWNENKYDLDKDHYAKLAYHANQFAFVSDSVRLNVLYQYGGVYVDMDMEILQTLNPLLHLNCFLGFQDVCKNEDWVNNAIMGSAPQNPFLLDIKSVALESIRENNYFLRSPQSTTNVLLSYGLQNYENQTLRDVSIFEQDYFYPSPYGVDVDRNYITPNSMTLHHWEGAWCK
ncbi:glycosyltransferase family 32 protein [Desulfovibrio sp. UCD-KL4C]|uniref:glycosyltransferase family 32 protein n=1 Tax=Desulfovibrio sp. UCD-KL4C TaxID=2578120 RepID=UPI0025BEC12B|nr:glycosyltransferase [Desulfovibrio sp. UCD-KL4C]